MKKGKKILIKLPDKIPLIVGEFYSWDKLKLVIEKDKINSNLKKQKPEKSKPRPKKIKQELKKTKKKLEKNINKTLLTKNKNKYAKHESVDSTLLNKKQK